MCCRCEVPDVEDYGNKWSASAALRHLRRVGLDMPTLVLRIEDAIIKSILSVAPTVAMAATMFQPHYKNCFGVLCKVDSVARGSWGGGVAREDWGGGVILHTYVQQGCSFSE